MWTCPWATRGKRTSFAPRGLVIYAQVRETSGVTAQEEWQVVLGNVCSTETGSCPTPSLVRGGPGRDM